MQKFIIALGAAPHLKLSRTGSAFTATEVPMVFESHQAAFDYLVQHSEDDPLKGVRAEIIEDLSLQD